MPHQLPSKLLSAIIGIACLLPGKAARLGPSRAAQTTQSRIALTQVLPSMPGSHLRATLLEVTYPPGGSSASHTHPCPVIGFVLSGAVRFRVDSGSESVLHAGQSFYESPNSIHRLSANASQTQPATFLAYFVCDGERELTEHVGATP
jgi:quercetin dioxygenase-like cupin family protein